MWRNKYLHKKVGSYKCKYVLKYVITLDITLSYYFWTLVRPYVWDTGVIFALREYNSTYRRLYIK